MLNIGEVVRVDNFLNNSSGSTVYRYGWPLLDMSQYDRVDFYITAPFVPVIATGANRAIFDAQVFTGPTATATVLTPVPSATATFGTPTSATLNVARAAKLFVSFNATIATGSTFSIDGRKLTIQSSHSVANFKVRAAGATAATSLQSIIHGSTVFNTRFRATTDIPVGATDLSSLICMITPIDEGTFAPTATGRPGATATEGVLFYAEYNAHIGVPAEKLGGRRYVSIAVKSSEAKAPAYVTVVRSRGKSVPAPQGALAVDVNL